MLVTEHGAAKPDEGQADMRFVGRVGSLSCLVLTAGDAGPYLLYLFISAEPYQAHETWSLVESIQSGCRSESMFLAVLSSPDPPFVTCHKPEAVVRVPSMFPR